MAFAVRTLFVLLCLAGLSAAALAPGSTSKVKLQSTLQRLQGQNLQGVSELWKAVGPSLSRGDRTKVERDANKAEHTKKASQSQKPDAEEQATEWKTIGGGGGEGKSTASAQSTASAHRFRALDRLQASVGAPTKIQLELSGKSNIRPITNYNECKKICPDTLFAAARNCESAAVLWCAAMKSMTAPKETYGPAGNQRIWSKVKFELTCTNNKVTSVRVVSKHAKVGKEGPLVPPSPVFDKVVARVDSKGVAHVAYMVSGRPHRLAEPSFQFLKSRACTWIWHFPYLKITSCSKDGSWSGKYQFGGSNFPSRTLWRDGKQIDTVKQGVISDLWVPTKGNPAFVRGVWPSY